MIKKIVLMLFLIACITGCSTQNSQNTRIEESKKVSLTTVQSSDSSNQASISNKSDKWTPNHVNINITSKKVSEGTETYVFISPTEGWKAYTEPLGTFHESIILYKTIDGGNTWIKIANSEDPKQSIIGGRLFFLNSKVGWIIKNTPKNGLGIYKTLDGGKTWNPQDIDIPKVYSKISFSAYLPVFFSNKDGIIFATCVNNLNDNFVNPVAFITHDGGDTWEINTIDSDDQSFKWSLKVQDSSINEFKVIYDKKAWKSNNAIEWEQL